MNVGNQIWDPEAGGRPSIKLFPEYSSGAAMIDLLTREDLDSETSTSQNAADPKPACVEQTQQGHESAVTETVPQRVTSDRDLFSGSAMAEMLGGERRQPLPAVVEPSGHQGDQALSE